MISSFTYELRRGEKGDIPGLCKRGSKDALAGGEQHFSIYGCCSLLGERSATASFHPALLLG